MTSQLLIFSSVQSYLFHLFLGWFSCGLLAAPLVAQSRLFYAGTGADAVFYGAHQLSDGSLLLYGAADDISWLEGPNTVVALAPATAIANGQGSDRVAFIARADSSLQQIDYVLALPAGAAENIRRLRTTNAPGAATGALYVSGDTEDAAAGGYFLARLDGNFVDALPTGFDWVHSAKCTAGDYPKRYHPWDVDANGRVYFVRGDSHDYNWSALYRLTAAGQLDTVTHWRTHWQAGGGEWRGTPVSAAPEPLAFSGIVFKRDDRCNLRSWPPADYAAELPDGNGGTRRGAWPLDVLFAGPCVPDAADLSGPGYTGYAPAGSSTYGPSAVTVDRRTGELYLGMNAKSVLPGGNPDFEPAVLAFSPEGALRWWSRLYHEQRPDGTQHNSSPDQYVDALAIDYANERLVVNARAHGNNVENLWEGNDIAANSVANGYQNRFTGTNGNIHVSWLGKLGLAEGTLFNSTYVAEYVANPDNLGNPHPDPLLGGWPDPNSGWIDLNTTYLQPNALTVTADGSVVVLGRGRRTMTTTNAHQQMPLPGTGLRSRWNSFVRQYPPTLGTPVYSSLVVGDWDPLTEEPPLNTTLYGSIKLRHGILAVGSYTGTDGPLPTLAAPTWGSAEADGSSAVVAYLAAPGLFNDQDGPSGDTSVVSVAGALVSQPLPLYPNPSGGEVRWRLEEPAQRVRLYDACGTLRRDFRPSGNSCTLPTATGLYWLEVTTAAGQFTGRVLRVRN